MTTATGCVPADADSAFRAITNLARLPRWNNAVTSVVDAPAELVEGAEWVVELHALAQTWHSRSTVVHLDTEARRFAYRSCTDDGNPSWVDWSWTVRDHPAGAEVTVTWELHPVTFWRRALFSHLRKRQLARTEVPASLAALSRFLEADLRVHDAAPSDTGSSASRHSG
jgi:hypothetical protein